MLSIMSVAYWFGSLLQSGGDKSGRSSRLSSSTDGEATANGEIDYKKVNSGLTFLRNNKLVQMAITNY